MTTSITGPVPATRKIPAYNVHIFYGTVKNRFRDFEQLHHFIKEKGENFVTEKDIARAWDSEGSGGSFTSRIASLRALGILEETEQNGEPGFQLTALGKAIGNAIDKDDERELRNLWTTAFRNTAFYGAVFDLFPDQAPSDPELERVLKEFGRPDKDIEGIIRRFRRTVQRLRYYEKSAHSQPVSKEVPPLSTSISEKVTPNLAQWTTYQKFPDGNEFRLEFIGRPTAAQVALAKQYIDLWAEIAPHS